MQDLLLLDLMLHGWLDGFIKDPSTTNSKNNWQRISPFTIWRCCLALFKVVQDDMDYLSLQK
jgi:hypothetical protein